MRAVLIVLFSVFCLSAKTQVNKGMPDIDDVVRTFFLKYVWTYNGQSDIQFEKRVTGWFVRQEAVQESAKSLPAVKFWDRTTGTYNPIPFEERLAPDTSETRLQTDSFIKRKLDVYEHYYYRRLNFYGYNEWDWDIIQLLNGRSSVTDSLLESLGLACAHYAMAYFNILKEPIFINGDSNRTVLSDSIPIGQGRAAQFIRYMDQSVEAWTRLGRMSPDYKTEHSLGRYSTSQVRMEAYTILNFVGYKREAGKYLEHISLSDTLMTKMKKMLSELAPNSILFGDQDDGGNAEINYLQATGFRADVVYLFAPVLSQRRALIYLDRKYNGTLLGVNRSVYMNPKYDFSFYDARNKNADFISVDSFLNGLSQSAALQNDNADLLMYYSRHVFLEVDKKKAEHLYGAVPFLEKLQIPIESDYLLISDMICLSVVNKNFLKRKIYFLYPQFKVSKETGMVKRGLYFELTPASLN